MKCLNFVSRDVKPLILVVVVVVVVVAVSQRLLSFNQSTVLDVLLLGLLCG